jgi:hypothetical protein
MTVMTSSLQTRLGHDPIKMTVMTSVQIFMAVLAYTKSPRMFTEHKVENNDN